MTTEAASIKDAVGNVLADGDTVTIVKDIKLKGGGAPMVFVKRRRVFSLRRWFRLGAWRR
ncbi:PhnA domain-containing protein [Arthrobacter sp. NPDC089319]|uniref:PhnA domain-containing protein n=1 Tax=Arthrobacter sp. NPDC089319 TaxID=3155915 RepID=UPI003423C8D2